MGESIEKDESGRPAKMGRIGRTGRAKKKGKKQKRENSPGRKWAESAERRHEFWPASVDTKPRRQLFTLTNQRC